MKTNLLFHLLFISIGLTQLDALAQQQVFSATSNYGCSDKKLTISTSHIDVFFGPWFTNGVPKYLEIEVDDPSLGAPPVNYIADLQVFDYDFQTFTLSFDCDIFESNQWFNSVDLTISITGYQSNDNGNSFQAVPGAQQDVVVPILMSFPDVVGPTVLYNSSPVEYTIPSVNAPVSLNWTIPNNWTLLSQQSQSLTVQSNGNAGTIVLESNPQVNACNYPAELEVSIDGCYFQGTTDYTFCNQSATSDDFLQNSNGTGNSYAFFPKAIGDFNGDGQDDLVGFKPDRVDVALSNGLGFTTDTWTNSFSGQNNTQYNYPRKVGDFDGDGKDDIIMFGHTLTQVGLSEVPNSNTFTTVGFAPYSGLTYSMGYTNPNVVQRLIGDFNNDGYDDIVGFGYTTHNVAKSNGTSFSTAGWVEGTRLTANGSDGMNDMNKYPKMVGDFNGDDLDDVIGFSETDVVVGLSDGSSFNFSNWTNALTFSNGGFQQNGRPRYIGDFNGDGKDDIIGFGVNDIIVGISTGQATQGFNMNVWLSNKLTPSVGWNVDARPQELGGFAYPPQSIHIGDANGDGLDDIIAFDGNDVYVAYSTGWKFLCPVKNDVQYYGQFLHIGDFNNDPGVEFIGKMPDPNIFPYSPDLVMMVNCDHCGLPVANIEALYHDNLTTITEGGNTVNVYEYCNNDITIDASNSHCEGSYFLEIFEYDLQTLSSTLVYSTDWVFAEAPDEINVSALYNFQGEKLYLINFGVGFQMDTDAIWVMDKNPHSVLSTNANEVRTLVYQNAPPIKGTSEARIYGFCTDVNRMELDGSNSSCYDEYRVELIEVDAHMSPTGSPIVQVPYGGGWNPGPIPVPVQISTNYIPAGSIYRLKLETKNSSGSNWTYLYVETADCEVGPLPGKSLSSEEDVKKTSVVLYPNPTREEVTVQLRDITTGDISVFSVEGKKLEVQSFTDSSTIPLDVSNYDAGQYLVRIEFLDGSIETVKLIKE